MALYDDLMSPQSLGLFGLAGGLLEAGGPSRMPVSLGQALNRGGMQGYGMARTAELDKQAKAFQDEKVKFMQSQSLMEQMKFLESLKQRPENPFGKIDPSKFTPASLQKFAASGNLGDLESIEKPSTAASDVGKLMEDLKAGRITQAQFDEKFKKLTSHPAATTVNVGPSGIDYGNPPKDMAWARDPDGRVRLERDPNSGHLRPVAVPVGGGSVEREAKEKEAKEKARKDSESRYADVVTDDIGRAVDLVKKSMIPVTGVGALASSFPGTPQHDLSKLVDTIKGNVSFDRLQKMRENSPTGGALGQVSDFENKLLQSTLGSLEQSQSKEQFLYNMNRLQDLYLDIIHGPGNRPGAAKPPTNKPAAASPAAPKVRKYNPKTGKIE